IGTGTSVLLCWSGTSGPPATAPGIVGVDIATGASWLGPIAFTNLAGRQITGLIDVAGRPGRENIAFADGAFAQHVDGLTSAPLVPMNPQPPAGGAAAFKPDGSSPLSGFAVGGAIIPFLYRVTWNGASGTAVVVAGPLPGDPVDFALPL